LNAFENIKTQLFNSGGVVKKVEYPFKLGDRLCIIKCIKEDWCRGNCYYIPRLCLR